MSGTPWDEAVEAMCADTQTRLTWREICQAFPRMAEADRRNSSKHLRAALAVLRQRGIPIPRIEGEPERSA